MTSESDKSILVRQIPKEWSDETALIHTVQAFRALRLFALRNDPYSFSATYEKEIEYPDSTWRDRLLLNRALHIAAFRSTVHVNDARRPYVHAEWIGMAVPIRIEPGEEDDEFYCINGMFVHPCARRQGLGQRLIEKSFEVIRADRRARNCKPVRVEILVDAQNQAAFSLYQRCGFGVDHEGEDIVKGELRRTLHMSLVLEVSN